MKQVYLQESSTFLPVLGRRPVLLWLKATMLTKSVSPGLSMLVQAATGNLKRVTLELGGKSPNVIFADTDLASAIPAAATAIFRNTGQVCCVGSRLYIEKNVFDRVVDGVAERAKSIKLGRRSILRVRSVR
jgi:acyl-CoA reductase-like NAD-dependent aldehyde dehydrogenase